MSNIRLVINNEIMNAIDEKLMRGLESCGLVAEGYAKRNCPVDTGRLRGSITHSVRDKTAYIGTNTEYATYVEFGTGKFAANGAGTIKESWVYRDDLGNWHKAYPQKPRPFLQPAIGDHVDEYVKLVADSLKK